MCMLSLSFLKGQAEGTYVVALQRRPPHKARQSHHLLPSRLWPPPWRSPLLWQHAAGVSPSMAAADAAAVEGCSSALPFAAASPVHALLDDILAPPAASGCQVCPEWHRLHGYAHAQTVA